MARGGEEAAEAGAHRYGRDVCGLCTGPSSGRRISAALGGVFPGTPGEVEANLANPLTSQESNNSETSNRDTTRNGSSRANNEFTNATLFPNPTDGIVYLRIEITQAIGMSLTDIAGKLINQETLVESGLYKINLEKQIAGVYLIKLSSGATFKVVKQ